MPSLSQSILVDNILFEGYEKGPNELTVSDDAAIEYLTSLVNEGREALLQIGRHPWPVMFIDIVASEHTFSLGHRRLVTFRFEYKS